MNNNKGYKQMKKIFYGSFYTPNFVNKQLKKAFKKKRKNKKRIILNK
jgi:hypothetical protein